MCTLSIVIPTYQRKDLVYKTVSLLLEQASDEVELIVVDDGSTDGTSELLASISHSSFRYLRTENQERAKARNTGAQHAKGQFINFFDSDDIPHSNHIREILEQIRRNPQQEVFRFNYELEFPDGRKTEVSSSDDPRTELIRGNSIGTSSMVLSKATCLQFPFSENRDLSVIEDYENWLRIYSNKPVFRVNKCTHTHRLHPDRSSVTMMKEDAVNKRFDLFLQLVKKNQKVMAFLGKDFDFFRMRLSLVMAVDLAFSGQKKAARKYLKLARQFHRKALSQKLYWATVKHLML